MAEQSNDKQVAPAADADKAKDDGKEKQLTPKQLATRRAHALTVINTHGTLEDAEFWVGFVDPDVFQRILAKMTDLAPKLKEQKAMAKIKELEAMGVDLSALKGQLKFK